MPSLTRRLRTLIIWQFGLDFDPEKSDQEDQRTALDEMDYRMRGIVRVVTEKNAAPRGSKCVPIRTDMGTGF